MAQAHAIESAIHQQLARHGTCSLDELADLLPDYSWSQVFDAVDRLTREGSVRFQHPGPFLYLLSLAPSQPVATGRVVSN
ncbi:MAG TPA: hypothetical protein VLS44_08770 [Nitrospira sp.]|nr:hypothetical protein [Nitrospira sp.]